MTSPPNPLSYKQEKGSKKLLSHKLDLGEMIGYLGFVFYFLTTDWRLLTYDLRGGVFKLLFCNNTISLDTCLRRYDNRFRCRLAGS
ncbi:MAG: hypothetical protein SCALA702_18150 [Melioribacteraceae bacterium]|nr:MAG: hypothetical protein SCALA702_18150 [Melioribacteraceae bacterium]